ncbi:MAG: DUF169 domain-containing protein [Methanobrevibacter sp.]|jgi:uncharacterized protein (DUF169 family)|nr:DUF169 domain-containing protein [Methanobrevibacter sp.]
MDESDILENNQYFSKILKEKLSLKYSPVAIKFILNSKNIPNGMVKIDKKIHHCAMVKIASEGESFYSTSQEQTCKGGSASLGLEDMPHNIKTGEFYYSLGRFKSIGSAKRTFDKTPQIDLRSFALGYAPLENANFQADVIVLITDPKGAMSLSQSIVYTLGGRINANFAGIQSVCSDAVAGPFITKEPNFTFACSGSRKFAKLEDKDMFVGLTGENIGCIVNALLDIK